MATPRRMLTVVDRTVYVPSFTGGAGTSFSGAGWAEVIVQSFRIDIYAWIPQPDVPNPIASLAGGTARWGPAACGPRFGGDDFVTPPGTYLAWKDTYRAKQSFAFQVSDWGMPPTITYNPGVVPGLTTVLTAPRSAGGKVCYKLTPTVTKSSSGVSWQKSDGWYQVTLRGAAHDPVPAEALAKVVGPVGTPIGDALTPDLEWDLDLRFQASATLPLSTRARYAISSQLSLDVSDRVSTRTRMSGATNLLHGLITVRRYPSYVVYVSTGSGANPTNMALLYFADASTRSLAEIVIGQTDVIPQLAW